nr:GNAT family N-acetyltransferase [Desertihabitans aurantiacus]
MNGDQARHPHQRLPGVRLRPISQADVAPHNAGEDEETIRWLSGAPSTTESTQRAFAALEENARRGVGKRGFAVLLEDELAGYIDFDPDAEDLPDPDSVNIAYAIHPWARRRGVATAAVHLVCALLEAAGIGRRAVIRAEVENTGSVAVARACGFTHLGDFAAPKERHPSGEPVIYATYARFSDRLAHRCELF